MTTPQLTNDWIPLLDVIAKPGGNWCSFRFTKRNSGLPFSSTSVMKREKLIVTSGDDLGQHHFETELAQVSNASSN
jgi:hypothetical protein